MPLLGGNCRAASASARGTGRAAYTKDVRRSYGSAARGTIASVMATKKTAPKAPAGDERRAEPRDPRGLRSDFPKDTLEEALRVPRAIHEANGGRPLPPTETAIALGISPGSSDLRVLLSSSLRYGLTVGSYKSERIALQPLALKVLEPTSPGEAHAALISAALAPETFRAIYDYFRGKKLPEATFFQNTVVREFNIPREHAERCVTVFNTNMEYVKLVRIATSGRWLSTEAAPAAVDVPDEREPSTDAPAAEPEEDVVPITVRLPAEPPSPPKSAPQEVNAIFLGHGKNKRPLAQLKEILDQYRIPYKIAVDEANTFRPISQKVADTMKTCGAAILIFTADEEFRDASGSVVWRPSENVVHELGAASVLYGNRIIIFKEDSVNLASNFRDIGYISFEKDNLSAKTNELFRELIAFGLIKVVVGS